MVALFSAFRDWLDRRKVLRILKRQDAADSLALAYVVKDELTIAAAAANRGDYAIAAKIWGDLVVGCERETVVSPLALDVLVGLKRFDEAEALMRQGLKDHPGQIHYLKGLVRIAQQRQDWEELIKCSATLRKRSPGDPDGYLIPAAVLQSLHRLDEAEHLTYLATKHAGHHVLSFSTHAEVAFQRGDWDEALKRFREVVDRFDHSLGRFGMARTLAKLNRDAEAEVLLLTLAEKVPNDASIAIELARLAEARGEIDVAVERWSYIGGRYANQFVPCMLAAEALQKFGAMDKSERILRFTVESFRGEHRPLCSLATLLSNQRKYAEAAEVWATLRESFPDKEEGFTKGAETLEAAGFPDEAAAVRDKWKANRGTVFCDPV